MCKQSVCKLRQACNPGLTHTPMLREEPAEKKDSLGTIT